MSTIEYLRKRAKLYLRWHREGYYPVAARIRALLPKYRDLSDPEILASRFRLADAQLLVARAAGFASWDALRRHADASPDTATHPSPMTTLVRAEPQLFVSQLARSLEFYVGKLGFTLAFSYGEPPFYASVFRDEAWLNLRVVDSMPLDSSRREAEEFLSATIALDDAKPLFREFSDAGVPLVQSLRSEPWGARTFIVRDPDGNLILFAGPDR